MKIKMFCAKRTCCSECDQVGALGAKEGLWVLSEKVIA